MKRVELSIRMLEEIFREGNIINHRVVKGLKQDEYIVGCQVDMNKRKITLEVDETEPEHMFIECVKRDDDEESPSNM